MALYGRSRKKKPSPYPPPKTPLESLMSEHLEWLLVQQYSEQTVETRRAQIMKFLDWCAERELTEPTEITRYVLERYQRHLFYYRKKNGEPLSFRSQHALLVPLRVWFRWMTRQNHILHNPASELELPKQGHHLWDHAVFSKNRERLLNEEVAETFFRRVLKLAQPYLSDEHFTVDGTLIEAWASQKSFRPKDEESSTGTPREADFHGQRRTNETHRSTTDPDCRQYKKSKGAEAKLSYLGHVLMENRNGLLVRTMVTHADGTAERDAALLMASKIPETGTVTLGADKNYDTRDFVSTMREMKITPHVAQNTTHRSSAIDGRTTRHAGYAISQRRRKRVEQSFGWMKMIGLLRKVKLRGLRKVSGWFTFVGAAYNLIRLRRLRSEAAA